MIAAIVLNARSTVQTVESEWGTVVEVLVVDRAVGPGDPLASHVLLMERPVAVVPDDAVSELTNLDERSVRSLLPGEILTARDLHSTSRSIELEENQRALTIEASAGLPVLHVGDRVDLITVASPFDEPAVPTPPVLATVIDVHADRVGLSISADHVVGLVRALAEDRVVVVRR